GPIDRRFIRIPIMRFAFIFLAMIALVIMCAAAYSANSISNEGEWPESWPAKLEPLRKQSQTIVGGLMNLTHYRIPFSKRSEFEEIWPEILKIKTHGAPLILLPSPAVDAGNS